MDVGCGLIAAVGAFLVWTGLRGFALPTRECRKGAARRGVEGAAGAALVVFGAAIFYVGLLKMLSSPFD